MNRLEGVTSKWPWAASLGAWMALLAAPPELHGLSLCGGGTLPPMAALDLLSRTASICGLAFSTALMIIAMMLPLVGPSLDHVAVRSGSRRILAEASFMAGLIVVWMVAMPLLNLAALVLRGLPLAGWIILGIALLWQEGGLKARAHRRCHARPPIHWHPIGLCLDCVAYGAATAGNCLAGCWAVMLAATTLGGVVPMMLVTVFVLVERHGWRRPIRLSRVPALLPRSSSITGSPAALLQLRARLSNAVHWAN